MFATWLACGISVLLLARAKRRHGQRDLWKVPMASGTLPIIGNVAAVKASNESCMHHMYARWCEDAGDAGLVRLTVLGTSRVLVLSSGLAADLLKKQPWLPKPSVGYNIFQMFGVKSDSLLTLRDGAEHARIWKHFSRFFCAENVDAVASQLVTEMDAVVAGIIAAASASAQPTPAEGSSMPEGCITNGTGKLPEGVLAPDAGAPGSEALVDIYLLAQTNIIHVVFKVFYETDLRPPLKEFCDTLKMADKLSSHPGMLSLVRAGILPGRKREAHNWNTLNAFNKDLLENLYAKPDPGGSTRFWACLRNAFPDALANPSVYESALANVGFVYSAGYETTANAIAITLTALAFDVEAQNAIAEELDEAELLAGMLRPAPRSVGATDLPNLQFLDAVCHESLRLLPPAPHGGFRTLAKDTQVGDFLLPKGLDVMVTPWGIHHNPRVWGPDAKSWRPDRWLEGGSISRARKDGKGNLRFLPFMDGKQNCIGQHLALMELKLAVASIVSRLHISPDTDRMTARSVDDLVQQSVATVTLHQKNPPWLRMRPRVSSGCSVACGVTGSFPAVPLTQPVANALAAMTPDTSAV